MSNQKDTTVNDLHITFSEVRSDEPHEAINAQTVSAQTNPVPKSHLSNKSGVFNVAKAFSEGGKEEGTIVSEKRVRHVTLGESLSSAFSEWFGKTKENIHTMQERVVEATEPAADTPVVPKVETRKEIIEKAATHAHIAPVQEQKVVIEKLRTYKSDVAKITNQPIIKPEVTSVPEWGHAKESTEEFKGKILSEVTTLETKTITDTPATTPAQEIKPAQKSIPLEEKNPEPKHIVVPEIQKSIVAPIVTKRSTVDIDSLRTRQTEAPQTNASLKRINVEDNHVRHHQKDAVTPDVAPVITAHSKKPFSPTAPTPEQKTTKEKGSDLPFIKKETPLPAYSTPVSHTEEKLQEVAPVVKNTPHTEEKQLEVLPPLPKEPAYSLESETPLESMPEFRSVPIPKAVKQELDDLRAREKNTVSQNAAQDEKHEQSKIIHYAILVSVLLLILVVGVGLAYLVKTKLTNTVPTNEETPSVTVLPVSSIAGTENISTISLGNSPAEFRTTLREQIMSAPTGLTEIQPLLPGSAVSQEAATLDILTFLEVGMPTSVRRALNEDIIIGSITTAIQNEPFIVLRSDDFDTLFSGMLEWEHSIQSDFSPLFGTPSTSSGFEDAVRNGVPARIERDAQQNEILVYSFINPNTVIITTSSRALELLATHF